MGEDLAVAGLRLAPVGDVIALEPLVPVRRDRTDESIASFFRRRFGAASVDRIAQPLLGGIHAGSIDRLSGSDELRAAVETGTVDALLARWDLEARDFAARREPYLIYK